MPDQFPFFSIVIPTFNRSVLIKETLDSLKRQTFKDFEVIVIDDGGSDNTKEIVVDLNDKRFKYHWKENEERAVARNTGTDMSKGKYINFFDSDDLAYPIHLQEAYNFIADNNNPEVFHLGYDFKSIEGKVLKKVNSLSESVNEDLLGGNILSCNGVFIRTDIALKHRFNPDRELAATEDYVLWLQLASRYTFHNKNIITSSVVDHESRSVIKINRDKLIKRKELSIKYLKEDVVFMRKYGYSMRKIEADTYTYIALHLAIAQYSVTDSISYLFRSLQVRKRSIFEKRFWGTLKTILVR